MVDTFGTIRENFAYGSIGFNLRTFNIRKRRLKTIEVYRIYREEKTRDFYIVISDRFAAQNGTYAFIIDSRGEIMNLHNSAIGMAGMDERL